ncbi:MAG: glutamine-hydrolyzing carbamoyl-phosphate synthase small subunit [Gammaproteobacteria bacterium]|nr:glutamine-hydrolyzing carbamoyl-phosphate synthase small subunit [Gammaproteobacteria bacterium]
MTEPALLALEDGTIFRGISIGADGRTIGEVVFNTAMTGYQEILTDPSYARQIVTLTYPHIGNTGTNSEDYESRQIFAAGLVIRDLPLLESNWRNELPFTDFLKRGGIPAIAEIDTRKLTRILREKGAQSGCIITGEAAVDEAVNHAQKFPGLSGMDLARIVSTDETYQWSMGSGWPNDEGSPGKRITTNHVVAYDFGVKRNILKLFVDQNCRVTVVPAQTPSEDVLAMAPDGVFLSNGPGDPEPCEYAIRATQEIIAAGVPVFGICLGHQILALASGAKTMKMKFGHHGANHPVIDLDDKTVAITSQNHGFAVDEESLPDNLRPTHRSLFDDSLQGVERTDCPAMGFQGHPEASPGPHDLRPIFARFVEMMRAHRNSTTGARSAAS